MWPTLPAPFLTVTACVGASVFQPLLQLLVEADSERTIIHAPLCSAATVAARKYDISATD